MTKPPNPSGMTKMRLGNTQDVRVPNNGMRNQGQSSLVDALGAEKNRQKQILKQRSFPWIKK